MSVRRRTSATIRLIAVAVLIGIVAVPTDRAPDAVAAEPELKGRIVYASNADGDYELFVMRADGTNRRQLTNNGAQDLAPTWAPDGRRIAFVRVRRTLVDGIFILNLRTGRTRQWHVAPYSHEGEPEWSPNGRWIVFRGNDFDSGSDVMAMRVDRSEKRTISMQDENSSNTHPTWSPDGRRIALIEEWDGSDIFVARFCCADGTRKRQVSAHDGEWKSDLDWSPSGDCLLFSRYDSSYSGIDGIWSIYAVPVEGGEPRTIYSAEGDAHAGSWSPDGTGIIFSSAAEGSDDIYTARSNGSQVRRLTSDGASEVTPAWFSRTSQVEPSGCADLEPDPEPVVTPP